MDQTSSSSTKRLREIFELLVRTMKTLSLYEAKNPVSERLESDLFEGLAGLLEEIGPLELKVLQYQILFEDEVVYENRDGKDSLAFLLSRDGIRGLIFQPGLQLEELSGFVSCLNRARALIGGEDDLATLLWDQDFEAIDYFVIEELADNSGGSGLDQELVGSPWSGTGGSGGGSEGDGSGPGGAAGEGGGGGAGGSGVTLRDLRPSARMPLEGTQLSEAETEALHGELAEESTADLPQMAVELAVELVMLEPDEDERRILGTALAGILDELLAQKQSDDFLRAFEHLSRLAREDFAVERAVTDLFELVRYVLSRDGQLARFFETVDGQPELTSLVERFLGDLPAIALPTLLSRLGDLQQSRLRRAVSDAILVHGDRGPKTLIDQLPALLAEDKKQVIDELLHMIRHLPADAACPLVDRLINSGNARLARRGALVLGQLRGTRVEGLLLSLLERDDPELRTLAIGALARSGNSALAPRLLEKAMAQSDLPIEPEDNRRTLAAVGRLGGDAILPTLDRLLQERGDVWFPTKEEKDLVRALVHGVRAIGSAKSKAYLEEMAASGSRNLRGLCREELAQGQR